MAFDAFSPHRDQRSRAAAGAGRDSTFSAVLFMPCCVFSFCCGDFAALAYTVPVRILISVNAEEEEERLALYLMM